MPDPACIDPDGVAYFPLYKYGSFFGTYKTVRGEQVLVAIPMDFDGDPTKRYSLDDEGECVWEYDAIEVTNVDESQEFVDAVNQLLDTKFTVRDFPGR